LKLSNRNPEDIIALFTSENGLISRLEMQIDRAISTSVGREGVLIARAGSATGRTAVQNTINDRIKSLNDTINTLQGRFERQQDRFWRMFTAMESQFATLNNQSSQLAGMFNNIWG
jgi:flagellar hook-associated protein 2